MCAGTQETRDKRKKLINALDEYVQQKIDDAVQEHSKAEHKDEYCSSCGTKK